MRVLITGRGTSGSWQIRGVQIAQAVGALAIPMASLAQCRAADVIIGVKRIPDELLHRIRESGKPFVWDTVDSYPQPKCSTWNKAESIAWIRETAARIRPVFIIWPNERMREDAGLGGVTVYHHHRPGIKANQIRERLEVVGYEGSAKYLEKLMPEIERECAKRHMRFVMNPENLADVDVVLAMRSPEFNGYPQQRWKSNVKLANAHGSGTPFIGALEDGYLETQAGGEYWANDAAHLGMALDALKPHALRKEISERFLRDAITVESVAEQYRETLCALKF
jgi:hypothetical protein